MAKPRAEKTLADYVAIAISPALIMVLVGSLAFFLLEVVYSGEFAGRLKWILFWFVFAAVLIARIGIEEGNEHAAVFIVAFWGAVALVMFRFLDQPLVGFGLLGVVWWCARKLTWDCTLIDETQDASGQGLLQITGLDPGTESAEGSPEKEQDAEPQKPPTESPTVKTEENKEQDPAQRPHAPGLWVVYFSLAALPLFGIGQVFIPSADLTRRSSAFRYLWFYVASGLGLLLTTSFLGLRRYLRQRKLSMPGPMTGRWIGTGALLAVGILLVSLILPRPNASYSMTKLVDVVSKKIGKASEHALGSDDAGKGEGRHAGREATPEESQKSGEGQKGNDGKQAGQTSKSNQPASGGKGKKEGASQSKGGKQSQKGEDKNGKSSSGQKKAEGKQNGEKQDKSKDPGGGQLQSEKQSQEQGSQQQQESASSPSSSLGDKIANLVKWLIYLAVAVTAVIFAIRYWETIKAGLSRFWQDLKDLFAGLFGRKPKPKAATAVDGESLLKPRPIRPFADYANPFRNGMEQNMGTIELIAHTYDALQAWGSEHDCPKRPDQTPTEYVQELARIDSQLAGDARQVALLYLRAAFSTSPPTTDSHKLLKKAWNSMETAGTLAG